MSSLIGKPLQGGKYKLDEVLGRGGFGLTFRAHQTYLDQVIVIKTLNESYWDAPNIGDLQRQFKDEARRLALCSHPNVVRVSDFFVEDGLPYMVMDYIPGRSLSDIVIPDNPLSEKEAVTYAGQIGRALQAVHAKGLLHRDVKPQNIMIHQLTGEAVLIDFGIARELTKNPAQTHTSIVSEGYAPIEQYLPRAQRSAATDVYGLAATLYTLLTAQVPVAAVLRDRTPLTPIRQLRPDVSNAVAEAIAHGMEVELKDRPQSVGPWLSELSGRTRTKRPNTRIPETRIPETRIPETKKPDTRRSSTTSALSTQVVSPAYQPTGQGWGQAATGHRTVAGPTPTGYGVARRGEAYAPVAAPKGKGCGCASTLMLLGIAIAGAFGGGGYWLYQQANSDLVKRPEISFPDEGILPEIDFPEIKLPEVKIPEVKIPDVKLPKKEQPEDPAAETETDANGADKPDQKSSSKNADSPLDGSVPMLLRTEGNPADDQPGSSGPVPAVPGIPPGSSVQRVQERLGNPTWVSESDNGAYYTTVYDLVPNRIALAYTYLTSESVPDEMKLRQSEAIFSPSTDRLVMKTALLGMLDGHSTRKIENGLEAVRTGARDRFDFDRDGFSGAIERNENNYIYLYVRD